jgi:hypothetical protein
MKATDFNLTKDLDYHVDQGMNFFHSTRLVMLDANALGLLRDEIVQHFGIESARRVFSRLGYQQGFADFMQMKLNYTFDSEMDLLASGPVIHTWEGVVRADPTEIRFDRAAGEFYFTGVWKNSYEAQQFLSYNPPGQVPVCWTLTGYASGWCTAFFGKPLLAIETNCMGMGHEHCGWLIQPPEAHGDIAKPYLKALEGLL